MKREVIEWRELPDDGMPDADETVHVEVEGAGDPTWLGWWDGEVWRDASTGAPFAGRVLAWGTLLAGSRACTPA